MHCGRCTPGIVRFLRPPGPTVLHSPASSTCVLLTCIHRLPCSRSLYLHVLLGLSLAAQLRIALSTVLQGDCGRVMVVLLTDGRANVSLAKSNRDPDALAEDAPKPSTVRSLPLEASVVHCTAPTPRNTGTYIPKALASACGQTVPPY